MSMYKIMTRKVRRLSTYIITSFTTKELCLGDFSDVEIFKWTLKKTHIMFLCNYTYPEIRYYLWCAFLFEHAKICENVNRRLQTDNRNVEIFNKD